MSSSFKLHASHNDHVFQSTLSKSRPPCIAKSSAMTFIYFTYSGLLCLMMLLRLVCKLHEPTPHDSNSKGHSALSHTSTAKTDLGQSVKLGLRIISIKTPSSKSLKNILPQSLGLVNWAKSTNHFRQWVSWLNPQKTFLKTKPISHFIILGPLFPLLCLCRRFFRYWHSTLRQSTASQKFSKLTKTKAKGIATAPDGVDVKIL